MTDQADKLATSGKTKRKAGSLIMLVLLISAIFADLQIHEAVFDTQPAVPRRRAPAWRPSGPAAEQGRPSLRQLLADPLAGDGFERLDGDPGDIAPPAGSTRRFAQWFVSGNFLTERASYEVPGQVDEVLAHYTQEFARRGFDVIEVIDKEAGGKLATFTGPPGVATLSLHKSRGDDRITRVLMNIEWPVDLAGENR